MVKTKKIVILLLVVVMMLSVSLVGCKDDNSGSATTTTTRATTTSTSASTTSAGTSAESTSSETEPFPLVDEKISLNVWVAMLPPPMNFDLETNWFTTWYEEKTNVHINWEVVIGNQGELVQKLNLSIASGIYPDVYTGGLIKREQQVSLGGAGVLIPQNELIDEYGVNILKMFEKVPGLRERITTPDGNIYGLPSITQALHSQVMRKMFVYKPWLDKLNIEIPETIGEFYDMLVAFKEQDPNGNSMNDEVPLATISNLLYAYLMNSFLYYPSDESMVMVENGELSFVANKTEFREGLKWLAKLVDDGLLAADSYTMDRAQITALAMQETNILGASMGHFPGSFTTTNHADPTAPESKRFWEFATMIPPLKGPTGLRQASISVNEGADGGDWWNITKECKNPEVAMRYVDFFFSLEGYNYSVWGPLVESKDDLIGGVAGWMLAKEGDVGASGKPALIWRWGLNNEVNVGWRPGYTVPRFLSADDYGRVAIEIKEGVPDLEQLLHMGTEKNYIPYALAKNVPPLYMSEDVSSEMGELKTILLGAVKEAMAQFVTGVKDINSDRDWNSYIDDLQKLGLERYMETYQKEYDRNYKK